MINKTFTLERRSHLTLAHKTCAVGGNKRWEKTTQQAEDDLELHLCKSSSNLKTNFTKNLLTAVVIGGNNLPREKVVDSHWERHGCNINLGAGVRLDIVHSKQKHEGVTRLLQKEKHPH